MSKVKSALGALGEPLSTSISGLWLSGRSWHDGLGWACIELFVPNEKGLFLFFRLVMGGRSSISNLLIYY